MSRKTLAMSKKITLLLGLALCAAVSLPAQTAPAKQSAKPAVKTAKAAAKKFPRCGLTESYELRTE